jgi:cell division protein FtsW
MIEFKTRTQMRIFIVTFALIIIGLVMVTSASVYLGDRVYHNYYYFLFRQLAWMGMGMIGMFWIMKKDYQSFRSHSFLFVLFSLILLICVFIPGVGRKINGANRWIGYGFFQLQPSEFAKLVLIIYLSDFLSRKADQQIKDPLKGFLPILVVMGLISLLVLKEPDLGTAGLLFILGTVLCLIAGMKLTHFIFILPLTIPYLIYEIMHHAHQKSRILVYFQILTNPRTVRYGDGYNVWQSLVTIGSGGLWGKGLGAGLQKYGYLPECHTDFIFPVICEEWGFIGALTVIGLFVILIWEGIYVAIRSAELYSSLLASGITAMISAQFCINLGMATGLLPAKGMTLPLVSYGGSSLLFTMIAIGLLMNIAQYVPESNVSRNSLRKYFYGKKA